MGSLDDEALARTIATAPVPIVTGVGHASDAKTLADLAAWQSCDTPSKTAALIREIIVAPARRARADHAAVLGLVSSAVARALPSLAALERLATAEALRQVVAAMQRLDRDWGTVREVAESTRGRITRIGDQLDRMTANIVTAAPLVVGRTESELAMLMEAARARARRAVEGADDGGRHLAIVAERAGSLMDTASVDLATLAETIDTAVVTHLDRTDAGLDVLARTVRERGRRSVDRADDGANGLAVIEAAVAGTLRAQDAGIARLWETVEIAIDRRIDAATAALDRALATLDAADPVRVLRRGYAVVMDGQDRVLTSVSAVQAAATSPLTLTFADGTITVRLTRTELNGDES